MEVNTSAAVIYNSKGGLLTGIEPKKANRAGELSLPMGRQEGIETPIETIVREMREKVGYKLGSNHIKDLDELDIVFNIACVLIVLAFTVCVLILCVCSHCVCSHSVRSYYLPFQTSCGAWCPYGPLKLDEAPES